LWRDYFPLSFSTHVSLRGFFQVVDEITIFVFFSLPLFRQKPIPEQVVKGVLGNNLFTETKKGKEYP